MHEAGIYKGVPSQTYHADTSHGSTSITGAALKSVAHCIVESKKEATSAIRLGDLAHVAILEPSVIDERFVVLEVGDCQKTTAKGTPCSRQSLPGSSYCKQHGGLDEHEQAIADAEESGKEILTDVELEHARATANGVHECVQRSDYPTILDGGERELSLFAYAVLTDDNPGYRITLENEPGAIRVCSRLDLVYPELNTIIDVKGSTRDQLSEWKWSYRIRDMGMNVQAALYIDVFLACFEKSPSTDVTYSWLAHEQKEPFAVRFFDATDTDIAKGRIEVAEGLRRWKTYYETGDKWAGWPTGRSAVFMPENKGTK